MLSQLRHFKSCSLEKFIKTYLLGVLCDNVKTVTTCLSLTCFRGVLGLRTMSLTVKREQIKKGVKRTKVPLIRIGVSDKPRLNCQFEPIRKLLLVRDNVTKRDR